MRIRTAHAQLGLDMIMFPQYVDNQTEARRDGICKLPCGCTFGCMVQQPPMQARADWGLKPDNIGTGLEASFVLQKKYGIFRGENLNNLNNKVFAQQCCDHLWMPPIRFMHAEALCDVQYQLFIAPCGINASSADDISGPVYDGTILSQDDAPIIEEQCAAKNLTASDMVLGWWWHWEGVLSMRV